MAGEKHADKAIAALLARYVANFETQIAAVETAQSLTAGALGTPVDYIDAMRDDDNQDIVMVYCDDTEEEEQDNSLGYHNCTIAYHFFGDADMNAGRLKGRRLLTAMRAVVMADQTLGAAVTAAVVTDSDYAHALPKDDKTRHAVALGVMVTTHDP